MYAFLMVLGAVITAVGLAVTASGVSVQSHSFDATNVTPGIVAVIGGCILIGLAFVVRALLRVERALALRSQQRPARAGDNELAAIAASLPSDPSRIPFPSKPKAAPTALPAQPTSAGMSSAVQPASGAPQASASSQEIASTPQRPDKGAPIVNATDVSLLPQAPAASAGVAAIAKPNGAGNAANTQRLASAPRSLRRPPQQPPGAVFDALWPRSQSAAPEAHPAAAPHLPAAAQLQPRPIPIQNSPSSAPAPAAPPPVPAPTPLSILKSGVVEGMAYTLYSDGSIEAQLPGGTVRFGSIAELRNHIEQTG